MDLTRWDPFRELEDMSSRLNRMLGVRNTMYPRSEQSISMPEWTPSCDIEETNEEYLIRADLPEVKKENVKLAVHDGVLTIEGERRQEKEEKGKKFHRVERYYGTFMRSFTLPENVEEPKVRAEFKDGVLTVHLPKNPQPKARAKSVPIT